MIACVSLPYFAAAVERRADSALDHKPLAIGGQPWEAKPIYAFSREVAHKGVHAGMSLRLVHVLSPHSHFMPAARPRYSEASSEVIDVLTDFSCRIEPEELWRPSSDTGRRSTINGRILPALYYLDLDGLPLPESIPFIKEMGQTLRQETHFAPAIGLAANKFVARVAAAVCRPSHALPVAAGDVDRFLSNRPLDFLPLEKETARRLRLLGIRTLGQLAALPLSALQNQFGPEIERLHRMARGRGSEPVEPPPAGQREEVRPQFEAPLSNVYDLAAVLNQAAAELAHRLQTAGLAGRELLLSLATEDGNERQLAITLRCPAFEAAHLAAALNELVAPVSFHCGIASLAVAIAGLTPATARQLTLFCETAGSRPAHQAIQNLAAKYKTGRFYQPVLTERTHPLPERRFRLQLLFDDPVLA